MRSDLSGTSSTGPSFPSRGPIGESRLVPA